MKRKDFPTYRKIYDQVMTRCRIYFKYSRLRRILQSILNGGAERMLLKSAIKIS